MRKVAWWGASVVASVFGLGCGSSELPASDPPACTAPDGGLGAAPPDAGADVAPTSDAGADGAACVSSWTAWSDGIAGGDVQIVAFDPRTPGAAWAAAGARVWRSADHGVTWSLATADAPGVASLAFPTGQPSRVLAATGDGLKASDDDGRTWSSLSLAGTQVHRVHVDPTDARRLLVSLDGGVVLRSLDGGSTWQPATTGMPHAAVQRFAWDASQPDVVVAGLALEDENGWLPKGAIARSTDGGRTWTTVLSDVATVRDLAQCAANPDVLYAATMEGIARSTDRGATWSIVAFQGSPTILVGVAGAACEVVYVNPDAHAMVRSTDGGATWSQPLTSGMQLQSTRRYPGAIAFDPADDSTLLAATHGGAYRSTDRGDQWSLAPELGSVWVRSIATSPAAPGRVWMATWGSGAWARAGTEAWSRISPTALERDWLFSVHVDRADATRAIVGSGGGDGDAWLTTDDAATFTGPLLPGTNAFVFAEDPGDPAVLYAGTQVAGVWRSGDRGATWAKRSTNLTAFVRALIVDASNPSLLVAGTGGSGMFRSTDGGATWSAAATSLAGGDAQSIVQLGSSFFASIGGLGVYRSDDGGVTWIAASTGLPTLATGGLLVDGASLYAVADDALYRSDDGATWTVLDAGCGALPGAGPLVVMQDGSQRWLLTTTSGGVQRRPL